STIPFKILAEEKKGGKVLEIMVRPNKKKGESAEKLFKNKVLKLVLEKTRKKYGNFVIREYNGIIKQSRVIRFLKQGKDFRVIATMTSLQREKDIWPIRIPLYKGLLGYRIFIIREEDQPIFSAIRSLKELKALMAIQGHDWPDFDILTSAGLKVYGSSVYRGIFKMLRNKRGDYFPRGVHEPWSEVKKHKDEKLVVEKSLLIQYIAPFYFFVRYGDNELHNRIREGLLMAIEDGSFDKLFYNHPDIQKIFKLAKIGERKIFRIKNPGLSKKTPIDKKKWWYSVGDEVRYFSKSQ
ncbi:MAG: amino acid ABC transporter substrate-binding protein, partial [Deltaproteobacteria bacterium]|nr:amino acid ABC transporter substrate-binding protein [Deltaproteobacteria bacterium]